MITPPRILFIDDQPELLEGFRLLLEGEGVDTFVLNSLITLPLRIKSIDPDLILVDVDMPALSGRALFSEQLRQSLNTSAHLILFSGMDPRELSLLADRLGADGALSKQQDVTDLLLRVNAFIRHHQAVQIFERGPDYAEPATDACAAN